MAHSTAFEHQARETAEGLRSAFRAVLARAVDLPATPTQLAEKLGIDTTLAWKLTHLVEDGDALSVFRFLPGSGAVRGLLARIGDLASAQTESAGVEVAMGRFNDLVRRHAGSRRGFDLLIANHLLEQDSRLEIEVRRAGFEAAAHSMGVRVDTQCAILILSPSEDGLHINIGLIRGSLGMQRLRSEPIWRMSRSVRAASSTSEHTSASVRGMNTAEPLATELPPVWDRFSDVGPDAMRVVQQSERFVEYALVAGEVGESGRFDLVFGELIDRARPRHTGDGAEDVFRYIGGAKTPCERLVCDLIVADGLFAEPVPVARAFSSMFAQSNTHFLDVDELRLPLTLGTPTGGVEGLTLDGCSRYVMMVREALAAARVNPATASVTRCTVPYPPVPMTLTFDWPRLPAAGSA